MRQVKCSRKDHDFLPEHWHIEYDEGEEEHLILADEPVQVRRPAPEDESGGVE